MTVCEQIKFLSYPVHSHKSIQFLQIVDVHYMKIFRNHKSVIVKPSIKQMIPHIRVDFVVDGFPKRSAAQNEITFINM